MFDTSMNTRNVQKVNAVSGTIVKLHPKSYFVKGPANSKSINSLMGENSNKVVLQAMLIGDMYLMCEVVDKYDYERTDDAE